MKNYQWMPLDTPSIMFTSLTDKKWGRTFRFSCTVKEGVIDPVRLKKAVEEVLPFFPAFSCALKKGFFWNYQEVVDTLPEIREETENMLLPITQQYKGRPNFRVVYYKNRVAVESAHFLSDGRGLTKFFFAFMKRYFELENPDAAPFAPSWDPAAVCENSFETNFEKDGSRDAYSPGKAYHFEKGDPSKLEMIYALIPEQQVLTEVHKSDMTVTEFMAAVMIKAVIDSAEKEISLPVTIAVPVDLRRFFPSQTARNFVIEVYVSFDPKGSREHSLQEICEATKGQLKAQLTKENLLKYINKYGALIHNPVLRTVPNVIKLPVLKVLQKNSHSNVTTIFTNLGDCVLDRELASRIGRLKFINGDTARYGLAVTCSCVTCNGILTLCFSHSDTNKAWCKSCINILTDLGIDVRIESSSAEEETK